MDAKEIVGFIILLVIGLSMTTVVQSTCNEAITGPLLYYTNETTNSAFSDNTGNVPDDWDNSVDTLGADNAAQGITNAWNANGYVTATRTDNGDALGSGTDGMDNQENSYWYQALTISDIRDGVTSTTVSYKYRVLENDNAADITIEILLDDGTDNSRLLFENVTGSQSASWTSVENNVFDNIVTTGTYTIYFVARLTPQTTGYGAADNASNIQVGWDDASITVTTAEHDSLTGASAIILNLVPLFYIIGLLLVAVAWISKGFKK